MGKFADYQAAAAMRDVIVKIAEETVNRLRPEPMVGTVYSFEKDGHFAYIQLPGHDEDELLKVRYGANMMPTSSVELGGTDPDVVRIGGKPGSYYILQFVRGIPHHMEYQYSVNPPGTILPYAGDVSEFVPEGYFPCLGGLQDQLEYPALFKAIKHNFNRVGDTPTEPALGKFRLPDGRYRNLIGADPITVQNDFAIGGNDETEDLATRRLRMSHDHKHSITAVNDNNDFAEVSGQTAGVNVTKRTTFQGHAHGGSTGQAGKASGDYHAWLSVNFIIKF